MGKMINRFDKWMIAEHQLYRISESAIYVRFPPNKELRDDLVNTTCKVYTLDLFMRDHIVKMLIDKIDDKESQLKLSNYINMMGDKCYVKVELMNTIIAELLQGELIGEGFNKEEYDSWKPIIENTKN